MNWKDELHKAVSALREVADSEPVRRVRANARPDALRLRYLKISISLVSPSKSFQLTHAASGILVLDDGKGNGLVVNAVDGQVSKTIGEVARLGDHRYRVGAAEGVNVVIVKRRRY